MISVNDIHWAAGFLEGEGCFTFCGHSPRAEAAQVLKEPLEKALGLFGGKIRLKLGKAQAKRQDCFIWNVNGGRAIGVMLTLFGLMSLKRQAQIKKVVLKWGARGRHGGRRVGSDGQIAFNF